MFVVDVLVCAPAALAKIRALRCNAERRAFLDFYQPRLGKLFFLAQDLSGNCFTLDRIRNKDSFPFFPADAFPAEGNVFDFQIDNAHMKISTSNAQRPTNAAITGWLTIGARFLRSAKKCWN